MKEPVFLLALAMAATTVIIIVRTIAGAFSRQGGSRSGLAQITERLEQQAADLEDAQHLLSNQSAQIAELEQRLDFTERILAQARDRSAVGPGKSAPE
jgi:exonuclease VII small subunit